MGSAHDDALWYSQLEKPGKAGMPLASEHMPLVERLRKGANCVIFLDGAPEPAADVADMLRKAANKIERLQRFIEQNCNSDVVALANQES